MKKSVLLGIIGLAAGIATSYGQGYITLDNYSSGANTTAITYLGTPLDSSWAVGLYFVGGSSGLVQGPGNGMPDATLALGTGQGSSGLFDTQNAAGSPGFYGLFASFNTGSTTFNTATLEVVVYQAAAGSYGAAGIRGHSAAFSMPTVSATNPNPTYSGDVAAANAITVSPVPEPTTLALAGLGGLASLVALRRKQS